MVLTTDGCLLCIHELQRIIRNKRNKSAKQDGFSDWRDEIRTRRVVSKPMYTSISMETMEKPMDKILRQDEIR